MHDVDFDDGMWKAKAENSSGNDVELKIDASSGKVIGIDWRCPIDHQADAH